MAAYLSARLIVLQVRMFMSFRLSSQVFIHSCVGPHTWLDNCVLRATLLKQFKRDVSLNGYSFVFSTNKCAYQFPWTDMGGQCLILERSLEVSSMNSCFKVVGLWKKHSIVGFCTRDRTTMGLPTNLVPFDFGPYI